MSPARRFLLAIAGIALLTAVGTVGYILIDHMTAIDALYMTVITITTVGYREVAPLSTAGRVFTMGLIFMGVGTAFYLFAAVTELVVEGQLREFIGKTAMSRKIHQLSNHVIVCGYGRFGRVVVEELRRNGMTVVVIERDDEKEAELERAQLLYVIGSAIEADTLERAAIATAREIVIATASDPDNVYIALSARSRNRGIRIHARAESDVGLKHLQLAGADRAISSYHWSALRIANAISRPSVVDFLELVLPRAGAAGLEDVSLEEVQVPPRSPLAGQTIAAIERDRARVRIVALKRENEPIRLIPGADSIVQAGDLLIAIGAQSSLRRLAEMTRR